MKKLICTSLLALAVSTANAAEYKPGFYGRIEGGANIAHNSTARQQVGTLPAFGLALGYKFSNIFRSELNLRYRQTSFTDDDGEKGSLREVPVLLNAYCNIPTQSMFTPYVTAGFGAAIYTGSLSLDGSRDEGDLESKSGSVTFPLLAWNAGVGSKFQLTKDIDLDLSYKFIGTIPTINNLLDSHNITLGLVYNF